MKLYEAKQILKENGYKIIKEGGGAEAFITMARESSSKNIAKCFSELGYKSKDTGSFVEVLIDDLRICGVVNNYLWNGLCWDAEVKKNGQSIGVIRVPVKELQSEEKLEEYIDRFKNLEKNLKDEFAKLKDKFWNNKNKNEEFTYKEAERMFNILHYDYWKNVKYYWYYRKQLSYFIDGQTDHIGGEVFPYRKFKH